MNKNIRIIAGVLLVTGVGYFAFTQNKTETACADEICKIDTINKIVEKEESIPSENVNVVTEDIVNTENGPEALEEKPITNGTFEPYSAEKVASATGDIVIFFHATWCPSCRALSSDIKKNLNSLPADLTILEADYDTETQLKKKYGVTTQNTLVQVDKDGNIIKKWSGNSKLVDLLAEVQ